MRTNSVLRSAAQPVEFAPPVATALQLATARSAAGGSQAALELEPANSYIVDRLNAVYQQLGDWLAAARMLRRALAAGAPARVWEPELASLDARLATPLAP